MVNKDVTHSRMRRYGSYVSLRLSGQLISYSHAVYVYMWIVAENVSYVVSGLHL